MAKPWREPVPGVILHRAQFGRGAKRFRNALRRALVIGRKADPDMTIIEDRVVLTVSLLDLVERLRDQECLDAVACHEGKRAFEKVETTERRKFVKHQQQSASIRSFVQVFGQAAAQLVENEPDKRLGAADVGRRHDEIECDGARRIDEIGDPPVALPRDFGDHRIAVETKERHRG